MPIFSTRFECSFTSSPLVSSVVSHLLHSFRVWLHIFSTRFECSFTSLHSFRVYFPKPIGCSSANIFRAVRTGVTLVLVKVQMENPGKGSDDSSPENYTRNEWRRCNTTLETSWEDVKLHSKEDVKLHSKRVEKMSRLFLAAMYLVRMVA
jgi:hypothetical protein